LCIPKKQGGNEDKIETELQQDKGKIMKSQATSTPLLKSKDTSDSTGYGMPELSTIKENYKEMKRSESKEDNKRHVTMSLYSDNLEAKHSGERQSRSKEKSCSKLDTRHRSNSSSSDSSCDKSIMWMVESENDKHQRLRSKSPQFPKMPTFS
jgi:hypothetical protein